MADRRSLHHAYLLIGNKDAGESFALGLMTELGIPIANNPDIHFSRDPHFGVDEARYLKSLSERKAFGERKFFVILADRISHEAQNALLKTFEEPATHTHYFIVASYEDLLLPTLRSRMWVVQSGQAEKEESAAKFLSASPAKRVLMAKKLIDDEVPVGNFIDSLLVLLRERGAPTPKLAQIFNLRKYADDTSGGRRLLLEHIALVV